MMSQNVPLILRLVACSVSLANRAGKIIRDVMTKGDLGIIDKGTNDYQTEADRAAQQCIVSSLSKLFPDITIIGEEDQYQLSADTNSNNSPISDDIYNIDVLKNQCPEELSSITEKEITVWVDPLDGTLDFTQGLLDNVTVLIGIAVNEKAIGGVIHQPYYGFKEGINGRTIWGINGIGVGGFELKLPPSEGRIVATTRSHSSGMVQAALDALKPDEIIRVGGAGYKVLLLLDGKAHAYVFASSGCKRWDTCGPEAVLQAAGGCLTDIHGNSYRYDKDTILQNSGGVLAVALKQQHGDYLSRIPDVVKNSLK